MIMFMCEQPWEGFSQGIWRNKVDVENFIIENYTSYDGDESFLKPPSQKTQILWSKCKELIKQEIKKNGVLDADVSIPSSIISHNAGFIDKDNELIFGLQTDRPLKRAICPYGGIRMTEQACNEYGYELPQEIKDIFTKYRKTHNDAVFSVYSEEMKLARKYGIITGLPDSYGRGRIIGDYRRVALYGTDFLIKAKMHDFQQLAQNYMDEQNIRLCEEISDQIKALNELNLLAEKYGFDISKPARNAKEAFQWLYIAFLGAVKETNGAANSLGRVSTFLDIYIERDIKNGTINEEQAQELVDQFVIKLRMIRHLRTPEYNELFAGDPVWITECIGGLCEDGRHMVTKNSYRFIHTLYNLGPAPEPNLTVLWSKNLPGSFKMYCAKVSIGTSALQYENDDLMRPYFGHDYSISCCVSAMRTGKDMQYFGARCNIPKLLLLALNGGRDEITGVQVAPKWHVYDREYLDYDEVVKLFKEALNWIAKLYVNTMNVIHYMHDKYAYERLMMALHDSFPRRFMAFGLAGLSVAADSLSAIKYARVKAIRDERGIITDFEIQGDYPQFGNDNDNADMIAQELVQVFYEQLRRHSTYRNAEHTLSVLTITSNIVYGKKTGSTPDGRKKGEPFAPGANPMHAREKNGILAACKSVSKIPYKYCRDGISYTLNIVPAALGKENETRKKNLCGILDGYFALAGQHVNINIIDKSLLQKAMQEPEKYTSLTVRVSGYAVNFVKLTRAQQREIMERTFHYSI